MDHEFWLRMGKAGCHFSHVHQPFARFRMITGTKSLSSPTVFWNDELEIFRRYQGSTKMEPFFAYYIYNKGIHDGFSISELESDLLQVLERFDFTSVETRSVFNLQAWLGFSRGLLLLASHFLSKEMAEQASFFSNKALLKRPSLKWSRQYLWYRLQGIMGTRLNTLVDRFQVRGLALFRRAFHRGTPIATYLMKAINYGL